MDSSEDATTTPLVVEEAVAADASVTPPSRRLRTSLQQFRAQMDRIDALERRVEARAVAARRRITTYILSSSSSLSLDTAQAAATEASSGTTTAAAAAMTNAAQPWLRHSHARLYFFHSHAPEITAAGAMAALMQKQQVTVGGAAVAFVSKPSPAIWTMHVEGKLLVDHLDHASAAAHDDNNRHKKMIGCCNSNTPTTTTPAAPNAAAATPTPSDEFDRSRGGGLGDEEESDKPQPLKFTHFFEKVVVTFQTVFQLSDPKKQPSSPAKKKSRRSSSLASGKSNPTPKQQQQRQNDDAGQGLTTTIISANKHQVVWKCNDTDGADMWSFAYPEPASPDKQKWKVQYVVAEIELYRRQNYSSNNNSSNKSWPLKPSESTRYRIRAPELQTALFPHHGPVTTDVLTGLTRSSSATDDGDGATVAAAAAAATTIPTHNQVHIPNTLTMSEIALAFFTYIQDRRLVVATQHDGSSSSDVVQCDTLLQDLLGMEQFSFSQLRQLLHQRDLIQAVTTTDVANFANEPVRITYILEQDSASVLGQIFVAGDAATSGGGGGNSDEAAAAAATDLSLLQVDMDIAVPNFFFYRARELLRRVKRREVEYSRSRSKARSLLSSCLFSSSSSLSLLQKSSATQQQQAASSSSAATTSAQARRVAQAAVAAAKDEDERVVRAVLEQCVTSTSQQQQQPNMSAAAAADLIPIQLALAQAAPLQSEARTAAHLEARMALLLQELQQRVPAAAQAWQVVEACQGLIE